MGPPFWVSGLTLSINNRRWSPRVEKWIYVYDEFLGGSTVEVDSVGVGSGELFGSGGAGAADAEFVSVGSAGAGGAGVILAVWDGEDSLVGDGAFVGVEGFVASGFAVPA